MIRSRSKLQRRDQDSGLVFSWRVPLTNNGSFLAAFVLVGLMSAGLAGFVRIKTGKEPRQEEQRASLVLVTQDAGGDWLDALAVEAGPYPFRWNPAADPAYSALRGQALREASGASLSYQPEPLALDFERAGNLVAVSEEIAHFPPLPKLPPREAIEAVRETTLGAKVVRSGEGPMLQISRLPLEARDAVAASGRRFMIRYQSDGRVWQVTPLKSEDTPIDLVGWLERGRVLNPGDQGGWLVVETTVEP